jgi:hypothetical protein
MINTLVLSIKATAALTANSVCRFSGGYSGTTPYLGVVHSDTAIGDMASVTVTGLYPVKLAAGQTVAVGEVLGINASGLGVANNNVGKVADFKPVLFSEAGFAYVVLA